MKLQVYILKSILLCILTTAEILEDVGKFLHLTDLHVDLEYNVGAPATCIPGNLGMKCCRSYDISISPHRLAGQWGDYNCDSPINLLEASMSWINRTHFDADFVIWTGDSPGHHVVVQTPSKNMKDIETITNLFKKYLPKTQVYPCIGNHDTWPIDQLGAPPLDDYLTSFLDNNWGDWLRKYDGVMETMLYGGYYSLYVKPGFKIITINNLYTDKNNILGRPTNKTAKQFDWLRYELESAKYNKEKVWIIGHIFPGNWESEGWFNNQFNKLVSEYSDIIKCQFWGHSHRDQFILNRDGDKITNMGYVTPSMMPDKQDPSVRVFYYNKTSMEIIDYENYVLDLTELNKTPDLPINEVNYTFYYSARKAYNLTDMRYKSWSDLVNNMRTDDKLFNQYMNFYKPNKNESCTGKCKQTELCSIQYVVQSERTKCIDK
jgi:sphingomyelin phosphodiesterase